MFALEIDEDHVHLFVQADPKYAPSEIAKQFKDGSRKARFPLSPDAGRKADFS